VDDEGELLDILVQRRRDTDAAKKFLTRLLRGQPIEPELITTDGLRPYVAAPRDLERSHLHLSGGLRENNMVENSHLPIRQRERRMQGFKGPNSAPRFLATHAAVHNTSAPSEYEVGFPVAFGRIENIDCIVRRAVGQIGQPRVIGLGHHA